MNDLPVHCTSLLFYRNFPLFIAPTFFPFLFTFLAHQSLPSLFPIHLFILWPPILVFSTLVITLRESQSGDCMMRRWAPVEVFIKMGLCRDWSCLAQRQPFRLCILSLGDPLSWTQCILFHGGLVILQRCAIIGICRGSSACVCVCVCGCLRKWHRMRKIVSKSEFQVFDYFLVSPKNEVQWVWCISRVR